MKISDGLISGTQLPYNSRNCYQYGPTTVFWWFRLLPRQRFEACHLLDGVFDERHLAVTNCLEGLPDRRGHWSRRADANEALDRSFRGYVNGLDRHVGSPGQNIDLFRYSEQFTASDFEDFGCRFGSVST